MYALMNKVDLETSEGELSTTSSIQGILFDQDTGPSHTSEGRHMKCTMSYIVSTFNFTQNTVRLKVLHCQECVVDQLIMQL